MLSGTSYARGVSEIYGRYKEERVQVELKKKTDTEGCHSYRGRVNTYFGLFKTNKLFVTEVFMRRS